MNRSGWIDALAVACERGKAGSRRRANRLFECRLKQVLNGSYTGNLEKVRASVEGALMGAIVDCPAIGEIPRNHCIDNQSRRQFSTTNPLRVQLHRACRTCENNLGGDK
jgi:hypothetical protein